MTSKTVANCSALPERSMIHRRYFDHYSHDASMFELKPKRDRLSKSRMPRCSKTGRVGRRAEEGASRFEPDRGSAGTDMSGGAINDSIIANFLSTTP